MLSACEEGISFNDFEVRSSERDSLLWIHGNPMLARDWHNDSFLCTLQSGRNGRIMEVEPAFGVNERRRISALILSALLHRRLIWFCGPSFVFFKDIDHILGIYSNVIELIKLIKLIVVGRVVMSDPENLVNFG